MSWKTNQIIGNRRWIDLFSVIGLLVIFIIIYRTHGFYYAINDDITMQSIASGFNTGIPDSHLIFIQYPYGLIISTLFKLFPKYDWYGLFLLGMLFSCFALIAHRILTLRSDASTNVNKLKIIVLVNNCVGFGLSTFYGT